MSEEGTITVERVDRGNGYLVRVAQADRRVRISLELLELIETGDVPGFRVEDGWLYISDDYAFQACYELGELDDMGLARWMEKL